MSVALLFLQLEKLKCVLFIHSGVTPNIINSLSGINVFDGVYLGFFTIVHSNVKETFAKLN